MLIVVTLQRQKRQRTVIREALPGRTLVRLGAAHTGDDGMVQVVPFPRLAARQAPYCRIRAIGSNQQAGVQLLAVSKGKVPTGFILAQPFQTRPGNQLHRAAGLECLQQRILHHAVLDDMAKHLGMYRGGRKVNLSGAGAVPHAHVAVRAGATPDDARPGAEAFENPLARRRQRADTRLERIRRRKGLRFKRPGIDQPDIQPALLQRQCQRAANHPGAHNDEVRLHQFSPASIQRSAARKNCVIPSEFSLRAHPAPWPGVQTSPWPVAAGPAPADRGCVRS